VALMLVLSVVEDIFLGYEKVEKKNKSERNIPSVILPLTKWCS
jgi:hypothetical protein